MSKTQVLRLYKSLITESKKFPFYNFRCYALRKIRDSFRENKTLTDQNVIQEKMQEATKNLQIIKRQVTIGQLYTTDRLVIENIPCRKKAVQKQ